MNGLTHLDIGQIGERATVEYYKRRGFDLVDQNYWKPYGEIDVVMRDKDELIFVEVKSVSCVTFEDSIGLEVNPAENVHEKKRARLRKVIMAFLEEKGGYDDWRFDVAVVQVNVRSKLSRVEVIEDVIL